MEAAMRTWSIALLALACGCGPMGNTLGMQGVYTGDMTVSGSGKVTSYPLNLTTIVRDVEISNREAATVTVEAGYENDAVLTGTSCSLPLKVDGENLELAETTICTKHTKTDSTLSSTTTVTVSDETSTISAAEVSRSGDTSIKVHVVLERKTENSEDDVKTDDSDLDLTMDFEGERIAGE
jgi:hypothetical protein